MATHAMTEAAGATHREDQQSGHRTASRAPGNGLQGGLPTEANHLVHARVLARAVSRLQAKYGSALDGDLIHHTVTSAYRTLDQSARLKTYLPILAARHAEDRLRALAREAVVRPEATSDAATVVPAAA